MIKRLRNVLREQNLEGMFVQGKENVRYLSGYTSGDASLLVGQKSQYLLTDPRYVEQAEAECPEFEVVNWRAKGSTVIGAVAALCAKDGLESLAFEAEVLSYGRWAELSEKFNGRLAGVDGVVEKMRAVKTDWEISCMRAACEISCRALDRLLGEIRVGVTEKELAAKLSLYMVEAGADTQPYGNILISGARTSLLHGIPSGKAVEYGDFVLMDFGCQYKGYRSDMTRTVVAGKADAKQKEVYSLEKTMFEDGMRAIKAGAPLKDVYAATVKAAAGTEYERYLYSGIGHGIGLHVHEIPFLSPNAEAVYETGNVTTFEPGIYIPGWGGVRIEDQMLITEKGYDNFVRFTHELIEL